MMKNKMLVVLMSVLLVSMATMSFAGDGGGVSQLELDFIDVQDTVENVGLDETISLNFSNNVVNMSVKDNNIECFSLTTKSGDAVEFEVFMGDDQVDKDIKRIVEIRPVDSWLEGTTYKLTISGDLTGKNGMNLGEDVIVEFTTEGESAETSNVISSTGILIIIALIASLLGGYVIARRRKKED